MLVRFNTFLHHFFVSLHFTNILRTFLEHQVGLHFQLTFEKVEYCEITHISPTFLQRFTNILHTFFQHFFFVVHTTPSLLWVPKVRAYRHECRGSHSQSLFENVSYEI